MNIIELTLKELIRRSNEFYEKTKGTNDEYNMYEEHVKYVYKYVLELSKNKSVDVEVLSLSALLHDVSMTDINLDRSKHNEYSSKIAYEFLIDNDYPEEKAMFVSKCILNHSSKRASFRTTEEERILVTSDGLSHFDNINTLYRFSKNVLKLNEEESLNYIKEKLSKDYEELIDEVKPIIEDKYMKIMNSENINEII